ncbi:hypothetical protein J6590_043274 [Homalodisca vitripennis]|nr:hypothetical protein J6590_043274 [Homalodisca vitripennis]
MTPDPRSQAVTASHSRRCTKRKAVKEWEADNLGLDLDDQDYGITNYAVEIDLDEEAGYMERFFKEINLYCAILASLMSKRCKQFTLSFFVTGILGIFRLTCLQIPGVKSVTVSDSRWGIKRKVNWS